MTNQDFIPIKFGIGQRCHVCFHQVNAQVLYYIVLLSIVIFVEWRHWGDNEFTPNVDIVSHGSGLFDCASKSLNTKNGASKNEHSQSVDFFASIGQTFASFPQAIWSSSCVLSGDLKPLQKPIRWTWLRWSCGLRPSCSKCWPMIRRFIPQKMWWSNESNSKDEQLFEYPWDSMRKLHMCVFFIAVSPATPRIIVTIVAWAGPFLFAPQFILEALLPQVPKPLLWLRMQPSGKSEAWV